MATSSQTTSSQTKNPRPDEQPDTDDRPRANGQRSDDAAAQVAAQVGEPARDAAVQTTDAIGELARQGQDGARRSVAMWTEMMTRLTPFALLNPFAPAGLSGREQPEDDQRRVEAAVLPAKAWAEAVFDLVEVALATQRRTVDHVLATQRQLVGQLLDTGAGLATAQTATAQDLTTTRSTRR